MEIVEKDTGFVASRKFQVVRTRAVSPFQSANIVGAQHTADRCWLKKGEML